MPSARKLTDIPSCMRMSFNFPWESSPEKEIGDPLSYDPPDVIPDFEVIYGEGTAGDLFPQTPPPSTLDKGDSLLPVLTEDSPCQDALVELLRAILAPESPSKAQDSPPSSAGCIREQRPITNHARTLHTPYQRRPQSSPRVDHPSLPQNDDPAFRPRSPRRSTVKPRPSPQKPEHTQTSQLPEAFADLYCRYPGCNKHFSDKRTTARHRLRHLNSGTHICPNPACDSRTKSLPHFSGDYSLKRHLVKAATDSPCAVLWGGRNMELFKRPDYDQAVALIQQTLVPFDPTIHIPF